MCVDLGGEGRVDVVDVVDVAVEGVVEGVGGLVEELAQAATRVMRGYEQSRARQGRAGQGEQGS